MSVVSVNHEQKRDPVSVVSVNHEQKRDPVSVVSVTEETLCQWYQWCQ